MTGLPIDGNTPISRQDVVINRFELDASNHSPRARVQPPVPPRRRPWLPLDDDNSTRLDLHRALPRVLPGSHEDPRGLGCALLRRIASLACSKNSFWQGFVVVWDYDRFVGCTLCSRAQIGSKHGLAHQLSTSICAPADCHQKGQKVILYGEKKGGKAERSGQNGRGWGKGGWVKLSTSGVALENSFLKSLQPHPLSLGRYAIYDGENLLRKNCLGEAHKLAAPEEDGRSLVQGHRLQKMKSSSA